MGIFKRLFKVGQAEANQAIDALEDPIAMIEQAIRDAKKDLGLGLEARTEASVNAKRMRNEVNTKKQQAKNLLESAQSLSSQPDKQALVQRAVNEAKGFRDELPGLEKDATYWEGEVSKIDGQIDSQQQFIKELERKLTTLRNRDKSSTAKEKFNKNRVNIDASGARAILERMERKIEAREERAEAYGEIADKRDNTKTLEEELRAALPGPDVPSGGDDLQAQIEALKKGLD